MSNCLFKICGYANLFQTIQLNVSGKLQEYWHWTYQWNVHWQHISLVFVRGQRKILVYLIQKRFMVTVETIHFLRICWNHDLSLTLTKVFSLPDHRRESGCKLQFLVSKSCDLYTHYPLKMCFLNSITLASEHYPGSNYVG